MKISEIDELAFKLYYIDMKKIFSEYPLLNISNVKNSINNFITFDYFYKEYYKKANILLRKDKIKKLLKNG